MRTVSVELAEVIADPERAHNVPREELPLLMAELKRVEVMLQLRLNGPERPAPAQPRQQKWLTVDEVAARLKVDRRWVYKHARRWRFAKRISRKKLLVSDMGLANWMAVNKG